MILMLVQKGRHPAPPHREMRDLIPLIWIGDATPWRGMTVWITFPQFRVFFGQGRSFIDCIRHIMNRTQVTIEPVNPMTGKWGVPKWLVLILTGTFENLFVLNARLVNAVHSVKSGNSVSFAICWVV